MTGIRRLFFICSNFIICSLNTKHLLAHRIPFLGLCIAVVSLGTSAWLHRTFLNACRIISDRQLPVTYCRYPPTNIWRLDAYFPRDTRALFIHLIIAFRFASLVHSHRPLGFQMMQQFCTGPLDWNVVLRPRFRLITPSVLLVICPFVICTSCAGTVTHEIGEITVFWTRYIPCGGE